MKSTEQKTRRKKKKEKKIRIAGDDDGKYDSRKPEEAKCLNRVVF